MDRLRRWLDDTKTSQTGLADLMGVKQPTVWEWLNGDSLPSAKKLRRLAEVTGVSVDELLSSDSSSRSRSHTSRKAG